MNQKIIKCSDFEIGNNRKIVLISGPCQMESEDHAVEMAYKIKEITGKLNINLIYKTSFDKANRTSIGGKRGLGLEKSLKVFDKIKNEVKLPTLTDVHSSDQCSVISDVIDVIQIPAFLARQTNLVSAAAQTKSIIQFKKPQFLSAQEMANVVEKCESAGNKNITLCERGNSFGYNNLVVDTLNFQILKKFLKPVIFDVTHSLQLPGGLGTSTDGRREFVLSLAKAGMSQSIAGLFLEAHPNPDEAKCDGPCALPLSCLDEFLTQIKDLDDFIKNQNNFEIK